MEISLILLQNMEKVFQFLGDKVYTFLLALNKVLNFFRSRLGFGYWSLAKYLKDLRRKLLIKLQTMKKAYQENARLEI